MKNQNILISGAGIAGPTLAYWLLRWGFTPTLVERATAPRTGGYMIDFWGVGWDVAERMELLPLLLRDGYHMDEVRLVNNKGEKVAGLDGNIFRKAVDDRYISVLRGDLASNIFSLIDGRMETMFDDSIKSIRQDGDGVDVEFEHSAPRRFDLVIGADGLHSTVRAAAFGEESRFEHHLGYGTAAFTASGYPHRDDGVYISYCVPGRQVARYSLRGDRSAFFFVFTDQSVRELATGNTNQQKQTLRRLFEDGGWECNQILDAMDSSDDLYFDTVSQIRMEQWSSGRVSLVGDACFCPSLLAGQGSAFAMAGAYILAGELHAANGDHSIAFKNYERFKPFIDEKQKQAARFGGWFAPKSHLGITLRNIGSNLMNMPILSDWFIKRTFEDQYKLPDYHAVHED